MCFGNKNLWGFRRICPTYLLISRKQKKLLHILAGLLLLIERFSLRSFTKIRKLVLYRFPMLNLMSTHFEFQKDQWPADYNVVRLNCRWEGDKNPLK